MKELLQGSGAKKTGGPDRLVYLFVDGKEYEYAGIWQWDLYCEAVFCSDVILSLPDHFQGTKGIIHPDDKTVVRERMAGGTAQAIPFLQFRIITTYGEIKMLTGRNLQAAEVTPLLLPEQESWQKDEQAPGHQVQKLGWQKRAGELAERLTGTGTWYYEVETGHVHYSDEVFRMHGLPRQSLNAHLHTFTPFIHGDDRDTITDFLTKALREQLPLHLDYRIVTPNGQEKRVRQVTHWEFNDRGGLMLYGTIQDITEQQAAEQKTQEAQYDLQQSNRLVHLAEQSAHIGHWHINLVTRKTVYSDTMYRLHGLKPGMLPAGNLAFLNLVHPDDRDVVQEVHKKILQQHTPPDIDYRIIRPDGKVRHLRQRGRLVVYGEGELMMLITLQDVSSEVITSHKMAELKQQVSVQQAVQHQAEALADMGSWTWEPETDKITWSEGLYTLLGLKPVAVEMNQKHLVRAVHPEDRKRFSDALRLAVDEKKEVRSEFRTVRLGETRQVLAQFRLISYNAKELFIGTLQDITRQVLLQQDVTIQAKQVAFITENMLDRVVITDGENTIRVWNRQCEQVYGLKREAVLGKNIFDVLPQLKNEEDLSLFNRVLNGETITLTGLKATLRPEYHDLHMVPLRDDGGHVTGILHLVHDVTKEYEMQQRLGQRLNFIEGLVEASPDRILVMDRYMNYLYCNTKAAAFYKLHKDDIIGKNVLEVFPASVNDPSHEHFRRALKGEVVHIPAIEGISDEHHFEVFLIPILTESGHVSAVLWIHHDLSGEIRLQRQLRKSHEILNAIEAVFIELDSEYNYKYINAKAELRLGKTQQELLGKNMWELFPQGVDTDGYHAIVRANTEKVPVETEYFSPVYNRWLFTSVVPAADGVIIFQYDRQDIKEAQEKLKQEHHRMEDAQKLGRIGSFEWNLGEEEVAWSNEMYRINGLQPQSERITIAFTESVVHPEDYGVLKKLKEQSFASPGFYKLEHRIVLRDGTKKWVYQQFESLADASGQVVRVRGTVQDITERKTAERELLRLKDELAEKVTDRYKALFDSIDQAFTIIEVIYDEKGEAVDLVYLETNPVFVRHTGVPNVVGRKATEVLPGLERYWIETYDQVVRTGQPVRFETYVQATGHWFDVYASRVGNEKSRQVAVVFNDITERKKEEERQTYLLKLSDALRELTDPFAIQRTACRILGEHLKVSRVLFGEVIGEKLVVIRNNYVNGVPPIIATLNAEQFGANLIAAYKRNEKVIFSNVATDSRFTEKDKQNFASINVIANASMGLLKGERWVAAFGMHHKAPKEWTLTEISLMEETAERTWAAVERAKAEEALRKTEQRLRTVLQQAPLAIAITGATGEILFRNQVFDELWGRPAHGTTATTYSDVYEGFHLDGRPIASDEWPGARAVLEGKVIDGEVLEIIHRNGQRILCSFNAAPIRDEAGSITGSVVLFRNVTAERQAEEALRKSEAIIQQHQEAQLFKNHNLLRQAEEVAGMGSWEYHIAEDKIEWSEGMYQLFDMKPGTKVKKETYLRYVAKEQRPVAEAVVQKLRDGVDSIDEILTITSKTGTRKVLKIKGIVVTDGAGKPERVLGVDLDITDLVKTEEQLRILNRSLDQRNKELEAKNEELANFSFIASHDLREPLRKIHTFSDWLVQRESENLSQQGRDYLRRMAGSVERMDHLIDDVLVLTKMHAAPFEESDMDLNTVLVAAKAECAAAIRQSKAKIAAGKLPAITGNKTQLVHLFKNLISNAIKFQKPGAQPPHITIKSSVATADQIVSLGLKIETTYIRLSFADNGIGFEKKYTTKIFQIFQRLHPRTEYEGTGIGLAICKKVMENHHGAISAESTPDVGSTFCCYFPVGSA